MADDNDFFTPGKNVTRRTRVRNGLPTIDKSSVASQVDVNPTLSDILADFSTTFGSSFDRQLLEQFEKSILGRLSVLVDKTVDTCVECVSKHFARELDNDRQNHRSLNLCIRGLKESTEKLNPHEREIELESTVVGILNDKVKPAIPIDASNVVRVRRVGKFDVPAGSKTPKPRPVIVTFVKHSTKMDIYRNKKNCKGSDVMITEDLTPTRRAVMLAAMDRLTARNVWTSNGIVKFKFKEKSYSVTTMKEFEDLADSLKIPSPKRRSGKTSSDGTTSY